MSKTLTLNTPLRMCCGRPKEECTCHPNAHAAEIARQRVLNEKGRRRKADEEDDDDDEDEDDDEETENMTRCPNCGTMMKNAKKCGCTRNRQYDFNRPLTANERRDILHPHQPTAEQAALALNARAGGRKPLRHVFVANTSRADVLHPHGPYTERLAVNYTETMHSFDEAPGKPLTPSTGSYGMDAQYGSMPPVRKVSDLIGVDSEAAAADRRRKFGKAGRFGSAMTQAELDAENQKRLQLGDDSQLSYPMI
jgi:hypothetical protein